MRQLYHFGQIIRSGWTHYKTWERIDKAGNKIFKSSNFGNNFDKMIGKAETIQTHT